MQDELLDQLAVQMATAKVKEDMLADLERRKENLRQLGQEVSACQAGEWWWLCDWPLRSARCCCVL
jgi:hypothetical protein